MSLEVHITKKLNNFTLKADLSSDGSCTGILGESGCGKSMFLKCIAGIETPDTGSIVLDGQILFDSTKKINLPPQKRNVGYLFQNYALFPSMTVAENIASGIQAGKRFFSRREKEHIQAIVKEQIERCRLQGLENQYPSSLSGGQQQRTALARILAVNPSMIMLDEPFSALDSHLKDAMQKEMHEIIRNYPGNVLIVSHSRDELYRLCSSLYVMSQGSFIKNGAIKDVFSTPGSIKAAVLTGCKNITPIRKINDHLLEAPEWGLKLSPAAPVTEEITHMGIRAHFFHPVIPSDPKTENQFQAQIVQLEEQPFEYDYYLKTAEGTQTFVWKTHKGSGPERKPGDWITFHVSPEDVMLLTE
ncbi:MAG: ATP-binding cassette domain-containing protein [Lachnospiraceae bacterium]|nr:ATP-binding cassette domain-containing protein [Lachnospiraceae bacterium]